MRSRPSSQPRRTHRGLLARLREAEETLRAIRFGQVDALVVDSPDGEKVFTLQGADFVYRVIFEEMGEGAASLGLDGSILYGNRRLAALLGEPLGRTIGASLRDFLDETGNRRLDTLLREAADRGSSRGELTFLLRSGREMPVLIALSNLADQGIPAVSAIVTDLTREKERSDRLAAANEELQAFNYSASHDLRSPLRTIAGFSQALAREDLGLNERGKEYCGRIVAAVQRMSMIIDAMLNLSRTTLTELNMTTVDLSAAAREIAAELQRTDPERKAEFMIAPSLHAFGDRDLLRQALVNLLGNAWKFTSGQTTARIEFGSSRKDGRQVFFIRDNGVGFDEAFADKLFRPFQRLHGRDEFPGTGVGLALVARIIRRHHGAIWARGRPGQGAEFFFELPNRRDAER